MQRLISLIYSRKIAILPKKVVGDNNEMIIKKWIKKCNRINANIQLGTLE